MKINKNLKLRIIKDQYFIVDSHGKSGSMVDIYKMNEAAAWLWSMLGDEDFTAEVLAGLLVDRYGIDMKLALRDVNAMLKNWIQWGLVME